MPWITVARALVLAWIALGWVAFLYQFWYYHRFKGSYGPRLRSIQQSIDDAERSKESRDRDLQELYADRASMKVVAAKSATLVLVHVVLVLGSAWALYATFAPITKDSIGMAAAAVSIASIPLTIRLAWLTWYSDAQYRSMHEALKNWRLRNGRP